jgi:hypothetical protein
MERLACSSTEDGSRDMQNLGSEATCKEQTKHPDPDVQQR